MNMASQADCKVALALLKEVKDRIKQSWDNKIVSQDLDPEGNLLEALRKQCEMAEKKAPDDEDVLLTSALLKAQLNGIEGYHKAASICYDKALELVRNDRQTEASIHYRYAVLCCVAAKDAGGGKQKSIQHFEKAIELYEPDSQMGIECAKELEKVKTMEEKSGGCFIATAAYGSPLAPEVMTLRRFRDEILLASEFGRSFVGFYYFISPSLASLISKDKHLRKLTRRLVLEPILHLIKKKR
jgi:tetratricopeptide (TPR) repeat protein